MRELRVGSLFSGIGGFDLGLERTGGFRTAWFCEQDEFCQRVLARHWPGVPCHPDITELRDPEPVDVLCGGFPCQDLSYAGKGAGLAGARSGLWSEYARLIGAGWWATEPDVGRVAHGVPARVDRLRALGNALVPQIAEWIGQRILDYEESRVSA